MYFYTGCSEIWNSIYQDPNEFGVLKTTNVPLLLKGKLIPNNSDLNTYDRIGNFYCYETSDAQTIANQPAGHAKSGFKLIVAGTTGGSYHIGQIYSDMYGLYYRTGIGVYDSRNWGSWSKLDRTVVGTE